MKHPRRRIIWAILVMAAILAMTWADQPRTSTTTNKDFVPKYDYEQLQDRISIVRSALPAHTADYRETTQLTTNGSPIWIVEWDDAAGNYLGRGFWSAETGNLISISYRQPDPPSHPKAIGNPCSAAHAAWTYIESLGIGLPGQPSKLATNPSFKGGSWRVVFACADSRIAAVLTPGEYKLLEISIGPLKHGSSSSAH